MTPTSLLPPAARGAMNHVTSKRDMWYYKPALIARAVLSIYVGDGRLMEQTPRLVDVNKHRTAYELRT